MKLIEDLGTKLMNGKWIRFGLFLCQIDNKIVEKIFYNGLKAFSCGCNRKNNYKHGGKGTRLYNIWHGIKTRCLNNRVKEFINYGGRGITICPEWAESYTVFRDWALSNGYIDNLEIDRKNTNGNYEPSNCRWVTKTEQNRNQRSTKLSLEKANEIRKKYETGLYLQKDLAKEYNIIRQNVSDIIHNKIWRNP